MKLFHLSDLHIGLRLFNRDLYEDQAYIFMQIALLAKQEQPDAILIAGDIYDKAVPSAEAVELFDRFITQLSEAVPHAALMLISGNHDSAPRVNVFRQLLGRHSVYMIGMPPQQSGETIEKVVLTDEFGPVNFYLLPFVRPSMVKEITGQDDHGAMLSYDETLHRLIAREDIDLTERNVLVSHQFYVPAGADDEQTAQIERMDTEIRTVGNIDAVRADAITLFDYAALGHIHKPMKVGAEHLRYCGTPMACSLSEAGQQKGIVMVTLQEKGEVQTQVLPLLPLRQIRQIRGTLQEVLRQSCTDYVSIVLTDKEDLDVIDMQEQLRQAFPYLLEIRRETYFTADYELELPAEGQMDGFALCRAFLQSEDEEELALLQDVINTVKGAEG